MLCQKWTARSMVMLIVAVWAVLGTSGSSLANQTFWEALWKSAFQQPYVHGRSGILLGSQQQPGVFELRIRRGSGGDHGHARRHGDRPRYLGGSMARR